MRGRKASILKVAGVVVLCSASIVGSGLYHTTNTTNLRDTYEKDITQLKIELSNSQYYVMKSSVDIKKGSVLGADNIVSVTASYGGNILSLVDEDVIGKVARVDIPAGDIVTLGMVSDFIPGDFREKECSFIRLNSNLINEDYVDVRIVFSNGEDYIVLSKKATKNVDLLNNNVFLWMNEEEILLLDSAVVDASINEGAFIYVTKYLDSDLQESSEITYLPSESTLDLIRNNPNIVEYATEKMTKESRQSLEKRISNFTEESGFVETIDVKNPNVVTSTEETVVDQPSDLETGFQGTTE